MTFIIYFLISIYVTLKILRHTLPVTLFYKDLYLNQLFGDQGYYWKIATLIKDFNFGLLQKDIISFRGYFVSVVPSIALLISKYTKINAYWLCYMINNFFICLLLGYIIPQLYVKLWNKKLENYKIFSLFIIFSIFWKGMYYSVLADMMGVTFLLWAILFVLEYIEKKEKKFQEFIRANLFSYNDKKCNDNRTLNIYSAKNKEEEVEETADEAVDFAENAEESTESAEVVEENLDQESDFSANTEEEKESEEVVENTEESADNEFAEKDAERNGILKRYNADKFEGGTANG